MPIEPSEERLDTGNDGEHKQHGVVAFSRLVLQRHVERGRATARALDRCAHAAHSTLRDQPYQPDGIDGRAKFVGELELRVACDL